MGKNLIISAVGDNSLHEKWMGSSNVDLFLIYYGDNKKNTKRYKSQAKYFIQIKTTSKYEFLKDIIANSFKEIQGYDYIWIPDDDLDIGPLAIDKMFEIMKKYDLWIAQPSLVNYINVPITQNVRGSEMRFTNFVEVMAPAFKREIMLYLFPTFGMTEFMWGVEHIWNGLLGAPLNKIAIIDCIVMNHTKAGGTDYSRFKNNPYEERASLWEKNKVLLSKTNSLEWYNKQISFKDLNNIEDGK